MDLSPAFARIRAKTQAVWKVRYFEKVSSRDSTAVFVSW